MLNPISCNKLNPLNRLKRDKRKFNFKDIKATMFVRKISRAQLVCCVVGKREVRDCHRFESCQTSFWKNIFFSFSFLWFFVNCSFDYSSSSSLLSTNIHQQKFQEFNMSLSKFFFHFILVACKGPKKYMDLNKLAVYKVTITTVDNNKIYQQEQLLKQPC